MAVVGEGNTKVQLGAKEYALRYTIIDGLELQRRLSRKGIRILQDLLGAQGDGKFTLEFDLEALIAALQVGIRHDVRNASETQIAKWLQEHVDNDRPIGDVIGPVFNALNSSGCFGFKLKEDDPEPDLGKAEMKETSLT